MSAKEKKGTMMYLDFYKADGVFYEGEVEYLSVPSIDGEYGVMAAHENVVVAIVPGILRYRFSADEPFLEVAVSDGMMRIEDGKVLILVESAERPEEIDEHRAQREAEEAMEAMLQKKSVEEYALAEAIMYRATNRLRAKRRRGEPN